MSMAAFEGLTEIHHGPRYIIYRAVESATGRTCAIKVPVTSDNPGLYNEAGIGTSLPNHSVLTDVSSWPGKPVLVRDFIEGISLRSMLKPEGLELNVFLQLAIGMAEDLNRIHLKRVLHRDISPDNLIVSDNLKTTRWIDFEFSSKAESMELGFSALRQLEGALTYTSPEQTGRMNRKMDYRADYYSLGAVYYEMLCGYPPFHSLDMMSLIHCHLALAPIRPDTINPAVPQGVADIVLKLLSKNAEDRYQSIEGLIADLDRCQNELEEKGEISAFDPGYYDHTGRLNISQKLYGRENELRFLEESYRRAAEGEKILVLLGGFSGIGKSKLAQELFRPVTADMGLFLTGKFDSIQRSVPYYAWSQALEQFAQLLLTEPEETLKYWRQHLLSNLNGLGSIITNLSPAMKRILGEQPELEALPAKENQQRIQYALSAFFNALSSADKPVVFFLDDWQWADDASLQLLEKVFTNRSEGSLMVIAAYRDNETGPNHPFSIVTKSLREQARSGERPSPILQLELNPLNVISTQELLADSLDSLPLRMQPLAEMVFSKTKGNPFATISFLESLHENRLLVFDVKRMQWEWDMHAIGRLNISENTASWLTAKVKRLPKDTIEVLKAAAAAGSAFRLSHVAAISSMRPAAVHRILEPAIQVELIVPVGNMYKYLPDYYESKGIDVEFRFTHDRIQQAIYQLIDEQERQRFHFQVGQLLAELLNKGAEGDSELLFEVAQHFANSHALIAGSGKEIIAGRLLQEAGEKAYQSAAFDLAYDFLTKARDFNAFDLQVSTKIIESAYMTGQDAEPFVKEALHFSKDELEKTQVREVNIRCLVNADRLQDAVNATRQAMKPLGIDIPQKTPKWKVILGAIRTGMRLPASKIETIIDLPVMTDAEMKAAMRILAAASPAFHMTDPDAYALVIFEMVRISLQYGNCEESIQGFSSYGLVMAAIAGKPDQGYKIGKQSLLLLDKLKAGFMEPVARFVDGAFIAHIKEPLVDTIPVFKKGYQAALRTGNLDYATWCLYSEFWGRLILGEYIPGLLEESAAGVRLCAQYGQVNQTSKLAPLHEAIRRVIEPEGQSLDWSHDGFNENELFLSEDNASVALYLVAKGYILCLFEAYDDAIEVFNRVRKDPQGLFGSTAMFTFMLYESIALIRNGSVQRSRVARKRVRQHMAKLAPSGAFGFSIKWLEAELAASKDSTAGVPQLFEDAIKVAEEARYNIPAAFMHRSLGLWLNKKESSEAVSHLREATDMFAQMGMFAVEQHIRRKHLPDVAKAKTDITASNVDTITLIKSTQALVGELKIDRLSEKLMRYAIENAGAQQGWLILQREDEWIVEVGMEAEDENGHFLGVPMNGCGFLAESIVNYTIQTGEPLVLDRAWQQSPFNQDPYIQENKSRSVLCIPFVHHNRTSGLLYLYNDLVEGAFTEDRVALLTLMGGQMGVSIENALLYEEMESLVQKRTRQLKEEKKKSDELLLNILPGSIAEELKASGQSKARYYEGVSILFADIKDFTLIAERMEPIELVKELDYCFRAFDEILAKYQVEKIKTIGDAYFCASGLPTPFEDHAVELVKAACDMQKWMSKETAKRAQEGKKWFELRVGIHSGPAIAGVVGASKFAYDIWGDTVNVAARMEQSSEPGKINISESTYQLVKDVFPCDFRGAIEVKNKGCLDMYFVTKCDQQ